MSDVSCTSIQATIGVFSLRGGKCHDQDGNTYLDVGAGLGPGAGIYYFKSTEARDSIDVEARGDIGLGYAGQASTLGGGSGYGVGISGQLGLRGLIPLGKSGVNTRPSK